MQDLQAVSEAVIPIHPLVTNLYPLLIQVLSNIWYFSVLDLNDAFFLVLPYIQTLNTFLPLNGGTLTLWGLGNTPRQCFCRGFQDSPHFWKCISKGA